MSLYSLGLIGAFGVLIYWMSRDLGYSLFWTLIMSLSQVLREIISIWGVLAMALCLAWMYYKLFRNPKSKTEGI